MRVVLVTSGSRGDVQPYCALAKELAGRGHDVAVVTERRMEPLVASFGLKYLPLAGDPTAMIFSREGQELLAKGHFLKVAMAAEKANAPHAAAVLASIAAACEGAGLVVTAALTQTATMCVAERLGVPWVPVFLGPVYPTREFPSWALSSGSFWWKWLNRKSYDFLLGVLWRQESARINKWRKEALGLPALKGGPMPVIEGADGDIPVILMCTHHVVPGLARPPDYPPFVKFTGFAYVPPAPDSDVDPRLRAFVAAGAPPVYLGFGSMPAPDPRRLVEVAAGVVALTGRRAVLVAGWSDISAAAAGDQPAGPGSALAAARTEGDAGAAAAGGLPDRLLIVPSAPHDWLLPRCCAAVHHCGIGTCAAALASGRPSVPCPVMLDQPNNARRLAEAGCAVEPLPFGKLTAKALAARIEAACSDAALAARAQAVAEDIRANWRGAAAAADLVLAAPSPWAKLKAAGVLE